MRVKISLKSWGVFMHFCKSSSLDYWNVGDNVDKIRALEENLKKLTTDADMVRVL